MTLLAAKIVWALGWVAWFIIRFPHQRRSGRTPVAQRRKPIYELFLLSVSSAGFFVLPAIFAITGWPASASYDFRASLAWLGTILLAATLYLFYRIHRDLGRSWSVTLAVRDQHRLVTNGVYRRLRHPMYSAFWLMAIAQALLLPNGVAGFSGLIGFGALFFGRIRHEEQMMLEVFGDDYRAYMRRTWRIIPGVY
jgi:protein-S-isoprenylcysteine O-methyltransferase Ste14